MNGIRPLDEAFGDDEDGVATEWAPNADMMILPRTADDSEADGSGMVDEPIISTDTPRDIVFSFTTVAGEPGIRVTPSPAIWPLPSKVKAFDPTVMTFA